MKSKAYLILLVFIFTFVPFLAFSQETLTITTYYPSPYGSYRDLSVYRRLAIGNSAANWINDSVGAIDGMQSSDAALFVPVYTGAEDSDLRLYIVDNAQDRFSIWGDSCGGGDCNNLNSASNIATFMGNGNVGIGTANPIRALHITSSNVGGNPWLGQLYIEPAWDYVTTGISLRTTDSDLPDRIWSVLAGTGGGTPNTHFRIYDSTAVLDRFNIDESGNVGIGTAWPDTVFQIATGNDRLAFYQSSDNRLNIQTLLDNQAFGTYGAYGGGENRLILQPLVGNVGIGTTAPREKLEVSGAGVLFGSGTVTGGLFEFGTDDIQIRSNSLSTNAQQDAAKPSWAVRFGPWADDFTIWRQPAGGAYANMLTILNTGDVGIGTVAPGWLLHVNGSAAKPGGGSWTDSSDIRLKKNIEPIKNALEKMLKLRGVNFEWLDAQKAKLLPGIQMGMISQEVEKVFPQWVGESSGYKDLTFRGFEALTVEALRELKAENEALKARIKTLEAKAK